MSEDQSQKLLIVGLDQAGKTSILNILQEKYNRMDNIKPTMEVDRDIIKIFNIPIITWDLGGQEKYRKKFLENPRIFEQVDSLFFVINAMNATRYEEALQYFTDILEILEKFDGNRRTKLVILIHKIDPNIREDPETIEYIEEIKQIFSLPDYELSVFVTSIYDRKSIIEVFSRTFQELIPTFKPIKALLKSLIVLLGIEAAILFDENLMILNEFYKNKVIEGLCLSTIYNSLYYLVHQNPKLMKKDPIMNFELLLNVKSRVKRFNFLTVPIKGWEMYLLTMGNATLDSDTVFNEFNSISHIFEKNINK